jgi:tetratricopeptide (TPR) repeat protein
MAAVEMYEQPFIHAAQKHINKRLKSARQKWRNGKWQDFTSVTQEEWEANRNRLPERIAADIRADVIWAFVKATVMQDEYENARLVAGQALRLRRHLFATKQWEKADNVTNALYMALVRWGHWEEAYKLLRQSIKTLTGKSHAIAQYSLASLLIQWGYLDDAQSMLEQGLTFFRSVNDKLQVATILGIMSILFEREGERDNAIEYLKKSLAIECEIGNEIGKSNTLHNLSVFYFRRDRENDRAEATACSKEAERINRRHNFLGPLASNLHLQGLILTDRMQPAEALECFKQSLEISRRTNDKGIEAESLRDIGRLYFDYAVATRQKGKHDIAAHALTCAGNHIQQFVDLSRHLGNADKLSVGLAGLGLIHEEQREFDRALCLFKEGLELARRYSPADVQFIMNDIARVKEKIGFPLEKAPTEH